MIKYHLLGLGLGVIMLGSSLDVLLTNAAHDAAHSMANGQSQQLLAYWDTQLKRDAALISYTKRVIQSDQPQLRQPTAAISALNAELKNLQSRTRRSQAVRSVTPTANHSQALFTATTPTVSAPSITVTPPPAATSGPPVQTVTSASGG